MILSLVLILGTGIVLGFISEKLKIPDLLGMIIAGVIIGPYGLNLLDESILFLSSDLRMIALVIILLRAGLGLNKQVLKNVGGIAVRMSLLPCLLEGASIIIAARFILGFGFIEAGILGFILAAVSPAVIVPAMIYLKEKNLGVKKGIPVIILAGASTDDIIAITMFSIFLGFAVNGTGNILINILSLPIKIGGGILLGFAFGIILYVVFSLKRLKLVEMEKYTLIIIAAFIVLLIGEKFNLAGLLAVMSLGFFIIEKFNGIALKMEHGLNKVWFFAKIFLFVLIGAQVNIQVAFSSGVIGMIIVVIGLLARVAGVIIALIKTDLNLKERIFCAVAYIPKATVQAAIGSVPLAMGLESGAVILAIAVLSIIITAPLGAIGIKVSAPYLLE